MFLWAIYSFRVGPRMNDFPHLVLLDGSEIVEEADEEVIVDTDFDPLEE